jgi:acyl carrier protein
MSEQQIAEQIKDTVQRWLDGKVDNKTFDDFIKTSNAALDQLAAEKKKKADEAWWRYSTTFC